MNKIGIDCRMIDESGIGRYISNLIHELSLINTSDEFVLFAYNSSNPKFENLGTNFKVVEAKFKWHSFAEQFQFLNLINSFKLDLYHSPHPNMPYFYSKDFVITVHDLTMLKERTGRASTFIYPIYLIKWFVFKIMLGLAIKRAKKVITVSEYVKKDISNFFPKSEHKVEVIYNGVQSSIKKIEKSQEIDQVLKKFNISKPFIFYVGNAYPHKNLERLILAYKLFDKNFSYNLVLGGKPDFFYNRLKNDFSDINGIIFTGELSDFEISCLYSGSQAFVYPSISEGFGIQIIEAIKCESRILCSDNTSFPEIAGDYAFYFNPFDINSIKEALEKHINTSYQQKLPLALKSLEKFSWKNSAHKHNEIYQQSTSK